MRVQFSSVQLLSHVQLFATRWIAAHQTSLSITNSWSSLKLMSIKSVMPSSLLILCRPLLLPLIPPSIRVFSNESTLHMRIVLVKNERKITQKQLKKNLFIGCAGSLLLCGLFSSCTERGLLSSCGVQASQRGDFCCCRAQALEPRFSSCAAWA